MAFRCGHYKVVDKLNPTAFPNNNLYIVSFSLIYLTSKKRLTGRVDTYEPRPQRTFVLYWVNVICCSLGFIIYPLLVG